MGQIVNLQEERCLNVLCAMYDAQMQSFFPDDALPKVMDKLELSEEETIQYVKYFLEKEYLKVPAFKPAYFLRPGYIQSFPVILTAKALSWLKSKGRKEKVFLPESPSESPS